MPLHKEKKLMFAHIPKCGGTSIENALGINNLESFFSEYKCKKSMPEIVPLFSGIEKLKVENTTPQHLTLSQLSKIIPDFSLYKKFSVVRNPYDRLVSDYHYTQECKYNVFHGFKNMDFKSFVKRIFNLSDIDRHVIFDSHFSTQKSFLYGKNNSPLFDVLFRFERLDEVFEWLDVESIHTRKTAERMHYSEYYDKETKDIVNHFYNDDFLLFKYDKE